MEINEKWLIRQLELEYIQNNQRDILKLKRTIPKIKNPLGGDNGKLETREVKLKTSK